MEKASLSIAPMFLRPFYNPGSGKEAEDCMCLLSVGTLHISLYRFEVLQVEMWQIQVKGYNKEEERRYDNFIPDFM